MWREGEPPGPVQAVGSPGHPWLDLEVGLLGALHGTAGLGEDRSQRGTPRGLEGSRAWPEAGWQEQRGTGRGGCGAAFSLLSAQQLPESPLDVARMTQLPQAAKAR